MLFHEDNAPIHTSVIAMAKINEEVKYAVDRYLTDLDESHYKQGIEAIEHRWEKLLSLETTTLRNNVIIFQIFWVFFVRFFFSVLHFYHKK